MDLKVEQERFLREVPLLKGKRRKERLVSFVKDYFATLPELSVEQKRMVDRRISTIIAQVKSNACIGHTPAKEKELERFVKELETVVVHVNSSFKLPEYKGSSPLAKTVIEKLLEGVGTVNGAALAKTLLFGKNKKPLLAELRSHFQIIFDALFENIQNESQDFWAEGLIGHLLSYYTFFDPPSGSKLSVPVCLDGKWQKIEYEVEKIPLTPSWMGSPMVAFGLTAFNGPPLLLFKGTSYPADEGFGLQVLSDTNPGASVGGYAFAMAKQTLRKWLKEKGTKARLFGVSLGGALVQHTVARMPEYIESAFAYCPPRLMHYELRQWNRLYKQNPTALPKVHIFEHDRDVVHSAGLSRGMGWQVYKVMGSRPSFSLLAHVECYLSRKELLILKGNSHNVPLKEKVLSAVHLILSVPFFLLGVILQALITLARKVYELVKKCIGS